MIDFNIGVSSTAKYEIKKIDSDYFNEDYADRENPAGDNELRAAPSVPKLI